MTPARLRGIVVSLALHVAGIGLAVILLREPATSALFIDLTLAESSVGTAATVRASATPVPPAAASAPRGAGARSRPQSRVASTPSTITSPSTAPPVPPSAAFTSPPSAPAPAPRAVESTASTAPPSAAATVPRAVESTELAVAASPPAASVPPAAVTPPSEDVDSSAGPSGPPAPSAATGATTVAGVDPAGHASETVAPSPAAGLATSGSTSSSAGGVDAGAAGSRADAAMSQTALAVPGDGGGAGTEYGAYLALVRRRIQESLRYPMTARRRGLTGSVHVEITVDPNGTIGTVAVVASSSHPLLDEAAVDAVRRLPRMPFPSHLTPRALRVRLPVVFELR